MACLCDVALIAQLCTVLRGGSCAVTFGEWGSGLGITFAIDITSLVFAALGLALSLAVTLYTWREDVRPASAALFHFLIGACYGISFTKDLFNAYVLFELVTVSSYLLVGTDRRPRQIWAGLRYLIFSSFGMSVFLLGIAVVYAHVGSLDLDVVAAAVSASAGASWVRLASALLVGGVAVKAGVFLFSLWLPLAHSQAPPAVSALLSGLVVKMGVVELYRLSAAFPIGFALTVLGVATAVLGIAYAVWASDLKKMLAFHTLSQIGYLLIGFGTGSEAARYGALDYAVAHGLFKALLFLAAGDAAAAVGSSRIDRLVEGRDQLGGATRAAIGLATLAILGVPPFAGYAAKAVLESGIASVPLRVCVFLISAGTAVSFAKLWPVVAGSPRGRTARPRAAAYAFLGTAVILFLPISRAMEPVSVWSATLHLPAMAEAFAASLLGTAGYRWIRRHAPRLPERIFFLEEGILAVLVGIFLIYALLGGS
ncbi:MAG: proton-conducting transporter membrane subunit [Candidatus Bipolaricaulota bacterium]